MDGDVKRAKPHSPVASEKARAELRGSDCLESIIRRRVEDGKVSSRRLKLSPAFFGSRRPPPDMNS